MKEQSFSQSYKEAGVDVTAGYKAVELMKEHVARTKTSGVLQGLGGFGGLFAPDFTGMTEPVLVSGTDGVGTKLRVAFLMDKHDTIGIDCVAMCVNDIICAGAQPLFFLDYLAMGKNFPEKVASIVSGVADGCVQSGCALVGGESAEMPGFYPEDEYDIAGFAVGMVDKKAILDKAKVQVGDVVIGIASSGIHSNGFSLVRKIFDIDKNGLDGYSAELGKTLGEELLTPTKIYVKSILSLIKAVDVHSISHITGGGFIENLPRAIGDNTDIIIDKQAVEVPPVFKLMQKLGNVSEHDMFNTFNMGTGMCVMVAEDQADKAISVLKEAGEKAAVIGRISAGTGSIVIQ